MCFAPKAPQIQAPPPPAAPPPMQSPLAPELPNGDANGVSTARKAATARKSLRIDLANPAGGAGLKIPM